MTNYYVYYRVEAAHAASIRSSVEELFRKVEARFGVRGRWMRRRDDPATYMEVYEGVLDDVAFEALLARETAGFGPQRSLERFVCA